MKNIKNTPKNILDKAKRLFDSKKDIQYTNTLATIGFSVSEDYCESIKYNESILEDPISKLEEIIAKIDHFGNDKKRIMEIIEELEIYSKTIFKEYEKKTKATKNPKVKEKIDSILSKINKIITEMKEIVEQYDDMSPIKRFVLEKCLDISSDLGENKQNLGEDFSYLKAAIEEHYGKKERRFKAAAAIGTAAIITGGIAATTAVVVQNKVDEIKQPLIEIYGSEENIPDNIYSQFFTESGVHKDGAEEKLKKIILSKALKNIINRELEQTTDQVFIENLKLNYGKNDELDRLEFDGYNVSFKTNIGEDVVLKIEEYQVRSEFDDTQQITGDKKAPSVRKWLEDLTLEESMNILKGDSEERKEFEENLENAILEINNKSLQQLIKSGEGEKEEKTFDDEIMK